jgi:hypothetical protein
MKVEHTMATMNVYLAKGECSRQTNGVPGGGKTFNWTERVAAAARNRRVKK